MTDGPTFDAGDETLTDQEPSAPAAAMVESIVGCKWSVRLLGRIADGGRRPSELLREIDGLSTKVMNERLRKLTGFGLVSRTQVGEKPPFEVTYALTSLGARFGAILREVEALQHELDETGAD